MGKEGAETLSDEEWWSELMMGLGSGCEDGAGQKMAGGRHVTSAPSGLARVPQHVIQRGNNRQPCFPNQTQSKGTDVI
jgi:hypothetical protein